VQVKSEAHWGNYENKQRWRIPWKKLVAGRNLQDQKYKNCFSFFGTESEELQRSSGQKLKDVLAICISLSDH